MRLVDKKLTAAAGTVKLTPTHAALHLSLWKILHQSLYLFVSGNMALPTGNALGQIGLGHPFVWIRGFMGKDTTMDHATPLMRPQRVRKILSDHYRVPGNVVTLVRQ